MESERTEIITKLCLTIGAYETARKIRSHPVDQAVLLRVLINNNHGEVASFISSKMFRDAPPSDIQGDLPTIPETFSKRDVIQDLTAKLREFNREGDLVIRKQTQKESFENLPHQDENGREFLTLSDIGNSSPNVVHVTTPEAFAAATTWANAQDRLGIDFIFSGKFLSTFTFVTQEAVYVFDLPLIDQDAQVHDLIESILTNPDIEKITHSFAHDVASLITLINLDPTTLVSVFELTEIVLKMDSEEKMGFKQMTNQFYDQIVNKSLVKMDWIQRPLHASLVEYSTVMAAINLNIFEQVIKDHDFPEQYVYVPQRRQTRQNQRHRNGNGGRRHQENGGQGNGRTNNRRSRRTNSPVYEKISK